MLLITTIFLLISNAVTSRRDKSILYNRTVLVTSLYSLLIGYELSDLSLLSAGIGLFGGLFHTTPLTHAFHMFLFLLTFLIVQLTAFYPRKLFIENYDNPIYKLIYKYRFSNTNFVNIFGEQFVIIEYPLILLFILTGSLLLVSSSDIVSIFLSIELQSYGLYLLAATYKNSELSTSASLVYFLLGGLSSCFILLGASLLYANSGSTVLDGYYIIYGILDISNYIDIDVNRLYNLSYLNASLLIMSVGLLFKVSAAPFHNWSPDVYDAIPTIVTTYVAIVAKISILVLLLELVLYTNNLLFNNEFNWSYSLLLSSLLSFFIGTILGLSQSRIKRLLAYSTISHVGFILLAIAINSSESIEAFIFYILQYSLSNLNMFFILISIGYSLYCYSYKDKNSYVQESADLPERENSPVQLISELKGYFYINPFLALSLAITLFSFVGLPPLVGFFAKQMVLSSALNSGYFFLAFVAILTSVISASYYLNIIKQVFFDPCNLWVNKESKDKRYEYTITSYFSTLKTNVNYYTLNNVCLASCLTFNISILTLFTLLFMFCSQELLGMTRLLSGLI